MPTTVTLADALANIEASLDIIAGSAAGSAQAENLGLNGGFNDENNGPYIILHGANAEGGDVEIRGGAGFGAAGGDVTIGGGDGSTPGHLIILNLPTVDPAVADALWNDAGTLKISAG